MHISMYAVYLTHESKRAKDIIQNLDGFDVTSNHNSFSQIPQGSSIWQNYPIYTCPSSDFTAQISLDAQCRKQQIYILIL